MLDVERWTLNVSFLLCSRVAGIGGRVSPLVVSRSSRIEIERALSRITVSRSGPNYQKYRVE
jgi:hypothetical protein